MSSGELAATGRPMYGGPALLLPGDGVATTRDIGPNAWEPATFLGYVQSKPGKIDGGYRVELDTGAFEFRSTRTLAIWEGRQAMTVRSFPCNVREATEIVSADKAGDAGGITQALAELRNWFRVELRFGSIARIGGGEFTYWPR